MKDKYYICRNFGGKIQKPMKNKTEKLEALARILDVLDMLRANCPWDKKQTNESLRDNTIEEVFELSQAILDNSSVEIKKELGDVLLHILFYSKIAEEKGEFDLADVCNQLADKLIYRHPHVYGNTKVGSAEEVTSQWEKVKQKEKGGNKTLLSGVPRALPSLIKAYRISEKAAAIGFDWQSKEEVWNKVKEEKEELNEAIFHQDSDNLEEEFGDLFFALVNAARLYGINPDNALERTNRKFTSRIEYIEQKAQKEGKKIGDLSFDQMNSFWEEAKSEEREKC
ncbi:MazG family protein [Bacteroidales bacterium KA00251]|nr:MazG family protein [Bacteroidales bacterium KA00251]